MKKMWLIYTADVAQGITHTQDCVDDLPDKPFIAARRLVYSGAATFQQCTGCHWVAFEQAS